MHNKRYKIGFTMLSVTGYIVSFKLSVMLLPTGKDKNIFFNLFLWVSESYMNAGNLLCFDTNYMDLPPMNKYW